MIWLALLIGIGSLGLRSFRRLAPREFYPTFTFLARTGGVLAALALMLSCLAVVPAGHVGVAVVFGCRALVATTDNVPSLLSRV